MIAGTQSSHQLLETGEESSGTVDIDALLKLLEKQGHRCALTGRTLTPDNCSLDHIDPFCDGDGVHVIENCQLVIKEANKAKGTMSQEEFIRLCKDVANMHKVDAH